ncbi:hypothetical protein [Actinomadura sp. NPDC000929]|uniref:hypothetical protein n=1 Tax=Actinomadura sp. NPDC000929 TaxID=3154517 RepID=UPI003390F7EB
MKPSEMPDHSTCANVIRDVLASKGAEITVGTAPPVVHNPYVTDPILLPAQGRLLDRAGRRADCPVGQGRRPGGPMNPAVPDDLLLVALSAWTGKTLRSLYDLIEDAAAGFTG